MTECWHVDVLSESLIKRVGFRQILPLSYNNLVFHSEACKMASMPCSDENS